MIGRMTGGAYVHENLEFLRLISSGDDVSHVEMYKRLEQASRDIHHLQKWPTTIVNLEVRSTGNDLAPFASRGRGLEPVSAWDFGVGLLMLTDWHP